MPVAVQLRRVEPFRLETHMQRPYLSAVAILGILLSIALGQEARTKQVQAMRGTLKALDVEKGTITITADSKDHDLAIAPQTPIQDVAGQPAAGGLKNAGFKPGAAIMFRVREQDGKAILSGIK